MAQKMRTNLSIDFDLLFMAHLFTAKRSLLFAANQTRTIYNVSCKRNNWFSHGFSFHQCAVSGDEIMPAKSKAQQQAAGAALAAKRGEIKKSSLQGASKEMAKSMTKKQLEEFASTDHKGLPEHVDKKD
jgi:hypothetical protein